MGNIIPFEDNGNVPAHIRKRHAQGGGNADLSGGVGLGYPIISYKGKVWHVVESGNRELVMNDEGEPRASLDVVILKANGVLSKVYYPDGYSEGSNEKPACYSNDSVKPAADASDPQAGKCAICPHNQWGSKITEMGSKGKACSDSRRLAVAPADDLTRSMLLRVPAASLKGLSTYAELLNRRGAPYQAVVTRIGFDHTVAYPSLTFKALNWLAEAEADAVDELASSETVRQITMIEQGDGGTDTAASVDELGPRPERAAKVAEPVPAKAKVAAKPKPAPEPEPEPEDEAPVKAEAPAVRAKAERSVLEEADASLDAILAMLDDD